MPVILGFGVKVTPKGRKVFIVLYRTGGAGSKLRKYTIGPYGRVIPKLEDPDSCYVRRRWKPDLLAARSQRRLETGLRDFAGGKSMNQRCTHRLFGTRQCTLTTRPVQGAKPLPDAIVEKLLAARIGAAP